MCVHMEVQFLFIQIFILLPILNLIIISSSIFWANDTMLALFKKKMDDMIFIGLNILIILVDGKSRFEFLDPKNLLLTLFSLKKT